jgi:hypothetical protein
MMEPVTEEMMKQNNLDLQVIEARVATNIQNWIRDNPYIGGETEDDDGKAYNDYMQRFNRFVNGEYGKSKWKNTSPYYQRMIERMRTQSLEAARNHSLVEQDKWRIQREDVQHAKAYANIDNAGWDIQTTLEAKMFEFNTHKSIRDLNPVEEYREKAVIFNSLFDQALNVNIGNLSVAEALKVLDNNMQSLEESSVGYFAEGETLDNFLENKQERISDAKFAVKKAIWNRDYNLGSALNAKYLRIAHDAVISENPALISYAQRLFREGSQLRETALASMDGENPDYNPEHRDEISRWFPMVGGMFGEGGGRGGRAENVDKNIREFRQYCQDRINDGSWTYEEGKEKFTNFVGELAAQSGRSDESFAESFDRFEQEHANATEFLKFWVDTKAELLKANPDYRAAFDVLDRLVEPWQRAAPRGQEALREWQGKLLGMYLFDKLTDERGAVRMTPLDLAQEAERVAGHLISGQISFIKEADYTGGGSDKNFGKAMYEMAQHPWARFVIGQGENARAHTFGSRQYQETIEDLALFKFSKISGIPETNLKPAHSKEGMYDEAAELNIVVHGMGAGLDGTYRFVGTANGDYHIERQDEASESGWSIPDGERFRGTAGDADRENRQAATDRVNEHAERRRNEQREAATQNLVNELANTEDIYERQNILEALRGVADDIEIWRLGFNPVSGAAATEIPARVWDDILRGMNPYEQEVQRNKWRQRGITRGDGNR